MDQEAEIIALRGRAATMEADIANLVGWQKAQNGSIDRVRNEVGDVRNEVNEVKKWMVRATLGLAMNGIGIAATAVFLYLQVVK